MPLRALVLEAVVVERRRPARAATSRSPIRGSTAVVDLGPNTPAARSPRRATIRRRTRLRPPSARPPHRRPRRRLEVDVQHARLASEVRDALQPGVAVRQRARAGGGARRSSRGRPSRRAPTPGAGGRRRSRRRRPRGPRPTPRMRRRACGPPCRARACSSRPAFPAARARSSAADDPLRGRVGGDVTRRRAGWPAVKPLSSYAGRPTAKDRTPREALEDGGHPLPGRRIDALLLPAAELIDDARRGRHRARCSPTSPCSPGHSPVSRVVSAAAVVDGNTLRATSFFPISGARKRAWPALRAQLQRTEPVDDEDDGGRRGLQRRLAARRGRRRHRSAHRRGSGRERARRVSSGTSGQVSHSVRPCPRCRSRPFRARGSTHLTEGTHAPHRHPPPTSRRAHRRRRCLGGDAGLVPRVRVLGHLLPRASRRARRAEAGAAPHPVPDGRHGPAPRPRPREERPRRRRGDGKAPPARRRPDLRRARAPRAAVLAARAARRRPRQLRLARRRPGRRPLHRGAARRPRRSR